MKPLTITDEMTEAALVKWFKSETTWYAGMAPWSADQFRAEMKATLEAALSTLPIAGEGIDEALGEQMYARFNALFERGRAAGGFEGDTQNLIRELTNAMRDAANWGARSREALKLEQQMRIEAQAALVSSPGNDGGQEVEAVNVPEDRAAKQARRERENTAFHVWWEESGHAADPIFTLTMENCAHYAWQTRADIAASSSPQPASTALVEALQMALERLITAIEREPVVGDLDYPHAHNDWLGWRKKILRPTASAAKAVLSASTSREGESRG